MFSDLANRAEERIHSAQLAEIGNREAISDSYRTKAFEGLLA